MIEFLRLLFRVAHFHIWKYEWRHAVGHDMFYQTRICRICKTKHVFSAGTFFGTRKWNDLATMEWKLPWEKKYFDESIVVDPYRHTEY